MPFTNPATPLRSSQAAGYLLAMYCLYAPRNTWEFLGAYRQYSSSNQGERRRYGRVVVAGVGSGVPNTTGAYGTPHETTTRSLPLKTAKHPFRANLTSNSPGSVEEHKVLE